MEDRLSVLTCVTAGARFHGILGNGTEETFELDLEEWADGSGELIEGHSRIKATLPAYGCQM